MAIENGYLVTDLRMCNIYGEIPCLYLPFMYRRLNAYIIF